MEDKRRLYEDEFGRLADLVIDTINNVKFTQAWRGYDVALVDNFLDDLIRLAGDHKNYEYITNAIDITPLRNPDFHKGFRGYDSTEVNNFLDKIAVEFEKMNGIKIKRA